MGRLEASCEAATANGVGVLGVELEHEGAWTPTTIDRWRRQLGAVDWHGYASHSLLAPLVAVMIQIDQDEVQCVSKVTAYNFAIGH